MGIDLEKLLGKVQELAGAGSITKAEDLEDNLQNVKDIVDTVHDALADGLQWNDLKELGGIIADFVELAEGLEGKSGEEKADFVVDAVWVTYKCYDPDIPWVPDFIENKVEEVVVKNAARVALEGIVKILNKIKGEAEDSADENEEAAPESEAE
jgi:hypothetical protein